MVRVGDFNINGKFLRDYELKTPTIFENSDSEKSEYPVKIEWIKTVSADDAKWRPKRGLFSSQLIKASLQGQPDTITFLENEFNIKFSDLLLVD